MSIDLTVLVRDLRSSSGFAISHPHLAHVVARSLDAAVVIERLQARLDAANAERDAARRLLSVLAEAGTGYSQQTMDAVSKERDAANAENREYRNEVESLAEHLRSAKEMYEAAKEERERLREALKIIAGYSQCLDNLMSNTEVARAALATPTAGGGT